MRALPKGILTPFPIWRPPEGFAVEPLVFPETYGSMRIEMAVRRSNQQTSKAFDGYHAAGPDLSTKTLTAPGVDRRRHLSSSRRWLRGTTNGLEKASKSANASRKFLRSCIRPARLVEETEFRLTGLNRDLPFHVTRPR